MALLLLLFQIRSLSENSFPLHFFQVAKMHFPSPFVKDFGNIVRIAIETASSWEPNADSLAAAPESRSVGQMFLMLFYYIKFLRHLNFAIEVCTYFAALNFTKTWSLNFSSWFDPKYRDFGWVFVSNICLLTVSCRSKTMKSTRLHARTETM